MDSSDAKKMEASRMDIVLMIGCFPKNNNVVSFRIRPTVLSVQLTIQWSISLSKDPAINSYAVLTGRHNI